MAATTLPESERLRSSSYNTLTWTVREHTTATHTGFREPPIFSSEDSVFLWFTIHLSCTVCLCGIACNLFLKKQCTLSIHRFLWYHQGSWSAADVVHGLSFRHAWCCFTVQCCSYRGIPARCGQQNNVPHYQLTGKWESSLMSMIKAVCGSPQPFVA